MTMPLIVARDGKITVIGHCTMDREEAEEFAARLLKAQVKAIGQTLSQGTAEAEATVQAKNLVGRWVRFAMPFDYRRGPKSPVIRKGDTVYGVVVYEATVDEQPPYIGVREAHPSTLLSQPYGATLHMAPDKVTSGWWDSGRFVPDDD